jgi:hypothetical protein
MLSPHSPSLVAACRAESSRSDIWHTLAPPTTGLLLFPGSVRGSGPAGTTGEAHGSTSRFTISPFPRLATASIRAWHQWPAWPSSSPQVLLNCTNGSHALMPSCHHALRRTSGPSNLLSPHGRHPPYTMRSSPLPGTKSSHRGRRSETTRAQSSYPLHDA